MKTAVLTLLPAVIAAASATAVAVDATDTSNSSDDTPADATGSESSSSLEGFDFPASWDVNSDNDDWFPTASDASNEPEEESTVTLEGA
eukprot:13934-Heterococcus_DN1.PRE.2